jgi:hypothetical protein
VTQTQSIVLGAAIALVTSVVVEYVRLRLADARTRRLLRALLNIEIPTICVAIDALVTSFNQLAVLDPLNLLQIQATRQGYDRNRDWIILFREDAFRNELIRFYLRLLTAHQDAVGVENFATLPMAQAAFVATRRANIITEFRDIAVQGRALLQRLDRQ